MAVKFTMILMKTIIFLYFIWIVKSKPNNRNETAALHHNTSVKLFSLQACLSRNTRFLKREILETEQLFN